MRISDWSSDVCSSDLYGAGATLWIAACWAQFAGRPITTYPDDTINQNAQNDGSSDSRCEVACATRELNASSWDPTAFAASGTQNFAIAYTFAIRSEEHTSEIQSLMRTSYAIFCFKTKKKLRQTIAQSQTTNNIKHNDK